MRLREDQFSADLLVEASRLVEQAHGLLPEVDGPNGWEAVLRAEDALLLAARKLRMVLGRNRHR